MAYIKLPYNEKLDITKDLAEKIKAAIDAKQDGDTPIAVSSTRTIKLRQVKDVDVEGSSEGADRTKDGKYADLSKHRELILKFGNLVASHGGFEQYCIDNRFIFPSRSGCGYAVNADVHGQYTDALELWTAYRRLLDLESPEPKAEKLEKLAEIREILRNKVGFFKTIAV